MRKLAIRDFSKTPGPRYEKDGEDSGEEFYPILKYEYERAWKNREKLLIDLDGITSGYSTGFLIESFGRLGKTHSWWALKSILAFISDDEPGLIKEVESYIYAKVKEGPGWIEKLVKFF